MSDEREQTGPKKILIDEDWKSQVERERKEAAESETRRTSEAGEAAALPPASFPFLVQTLATQALVALGELPNPLTQKTDQDLAQAKHFIDTLGILDEKTRGNLTAAEQRLLESLLFDLRMRFVEVSSKVRQPGAS